MKLPDQSGGPRVSSRLNSRGFVIQKLVMMVRTWFALSPTGVLHLGSVRTALFCWLYAGRHGGHFILRIKDTDRKRSIKENADAILEGMEWLGLDADEGPFYQTDRFDRFKEAIDDHDLNILIVVRGDDHLNNTPRQMNMLAALGAMPPCNAHLPMILGPDGAKLSKRHDAVDIREYSAEGYLPEAILNYEDFEEIEPKTAKKHLRPVILEPMVAVADALASLPERTTDRIDQLIQEVAAEFEINMGKVGQPIRVALAGGPVSPPIDVTVWLVGCERVLKRLDHAIGLIKDGAVAQLGERLHGMQEFGGSIPPSYTRFYRINVLRPHRLEAKDFVPSRR